MKIKCLVIDDERLARVYLKNYIQKVPELELLGEYNNAFKSIEDIKRGDVDLIFLDIQMPDINGIDFVKTLKNPPYIIFTTAYQDYAIEGFNLNVVDYLLKPFPFERFYSAVNKVIDLKKSFEINSVPNDASQAIINNSFSNSYLTIRADRKYYKINFDDIIYIEGQKAYVTFHTTLKNITALASLRNLEESLPKNKFIRIHKSFIVSIKNINAMEGNLLEVGKINLPIGSTYKNDVCKIFNC